MDQHWCRKIHSRGMKITRVVKHGRAFDAAAVESLLLLTLFMVEHQDREDVPPSHIIQHNMAIRRRLRLRAR